MVSFNLIRLQILIDICCQIIFYLIREVIKRIPVPSCSNLTMLFVNDSLKFTSSDTQICWYFFAEKMWVAFAPQKLLTFFQQKNIRILYIESAKTVNEMTLNELVKLTTLWKIGPRKRIKLPIRKLNLSCCGFHIISPEIVYEISSYHMTTHTSKSTSKSISFKDDFNIR